MKYLHGLENKSEDATESSIEKLENKNYVNIYNINKAKNSD